MSSENVEPILKSFQLSSKWNQGKVVEDSLLPKQLNRLQSLFQHVWREEQASTTLNWGTKNFSYLLPESLQVLSSMFLRIQLPALQNGTYKKNVGKSMIHARYGVKMSPKVAQNDVISVMIF